MRKRKFPEIHKEYKKYKSEEKHIKQLYNQVKEEYINDKNLDIELEKIYLKTSLEEYTSDTLNKYVKMIWIYITVVITISLENALNKNDNIFLLIIISAIVTLISIGVGILVEKSIIKKEIDKQIYYNVCLEVLTELENEKNK